MGAMRLPVIDGDDRVIDSAQTEEMVAFAMKQGVNYYDTAWDITMEIRRSFLEKRSVNIPVKATILPINFQSMTLPI